MQLLPLLETDPKNVQDLRENMELKLKCTFGPSFGNSIVVTQGSVMEHTAITASDVPAAVKGLKSVRITQKIVSGTIQFAVNVNTNRSLNNLTFSCSSDFANWVQVINSTQPIVVKCKYFCDWLTLVMYGFVYLFQMVLLEMYPAALGVLVVLLQVHVQLLFLMQVR